MNYHIPGYVASSFSSLRSFCLSSRVSTGLAVWVAPSPAAWPSRDEPSLPSPPGFDFCAASARPVDSPFGTSFSGGTGLGVPARLGSSLSSITKAASKMAGSGFGAASPASASGFLDRDRLPAPPSPARDAEEADLAMGEPASRAFCWRACSSAMVRSMAPLIRCNWGNHGQLAKHVLLRVLLSIVRVHRHWGSHLLGTSLRWGHLTR